MGNTHTHGLRWYLGEADSRLPFNDDGGTPAATPKAPTLAALPNFTPDACDGRVESEETLLLEGASACLCCNVLLLLRKVCDGARLLVVLLLVPVPEA